MVKKWFILGGYPVMGGYTALIMRLLYASPFITSTGPTKQILMALKLATYSSGKNLQVFPTGRVGQVKGWHLLMPA